MSCTSCWHLQAKNASSFAFESSNGQSQWFKVWLCIRSSNKSTPAPYRWYNVGIAYNLNAIINVLVMVTFTCTSRFKSSRSVRDLGDAKVTCAIANFEFFEEKFIIVIPRFRDYVVYEPLPHPPKIKINNKNGSKVSPFRLISLQFSVTSSRETDNTTT